jgi:oligoendopeptidase F
MPTALPRSNVKQNQTWNAESVFGSPEAFDMEVKSLLESLPAIKAFQGHLGDSPDIFIEAMNAMEMLAQRASKVQVYATLFSAVDATDQ